MDMKIVTVFQKTPDYFSDKPTLNALCCLPYFSLFHTLKQDLVNNLSFTPEFSHMAECNKFLL